MRKNAFKITLISILFIIIAVTVRSIFLNSIYSYGREINITSRPKGISVILRVTDGGFGDTTELFVKDNVRIERLYRWGTGISAPRIEDVWWSKDGTFLIINEPGPNGSGYDFVQRKLLENIDTTAIAKKRGGKGQRLVMYQMVYGELRTAYTKEQTALEHAYTAPGNYL